MARTLGAAQIETIFDPLQPALQAIDSGRLSGKIAMQVGNRDSQRREPLLDLAYILSNTAYIGADCPKVLKNEIVRIIGHAFSYACTNTRSINSRWQHIRLAWIAR